MTVVDPFEPKLSRETFQAMCRCGPVVSAAWHLPTERGMHLFEINTPGRIAAYLAVITHESGCLTRFEESLYYSRPERLVEVWPSRFHPVGAPAEGMRNPLEFVRQPEKLANFVYANRMGNGDEASGDGWRFRGRTLGQATGRDMYRAIGERFGWPCEEHPGLLLDPDKGALATAFIWQMKRCNDPADAENMTEIRRRWQGGRTGLAECLALYAANRRLLGMT